MLEHKIPGRAEKERIHTASETVSGIALPTVILEMSRSSNRSVLVGASVFFFFPSLANGFLPLDRTRLAVYNLNSKLIDVQIDKTLTTIFQQEGK